MGPFAALNSVIVNAFNFSGRAPRSEFWWFVMWDVLFAIIALTVDIWGIVVATGQFQNMHKIPMDPFEYVVIYWALLSFIPRLSLTIRRLHDAGFSGFWYLLNFVPLGALVLFVLMFFPSENGSNIHGRPKNPTGGSPRKSASGKPHDPMQGYAYLEASRKAPTPEMLAERKAQVRALYEQRVLGQQGKPA